MKKRTMVFFLIASILLLLMQFLTYRYREEQGISNIHSRETILTTQASSEITDWLSQALQELTYLSVKENVVSYLNAPNELARSRVEEGFVQFSGSTAIYDQIRLLDTSGMEMVRVDYDQGGPVIISKEELQDKSDRYYFIDCNNLDVGDYFISPLDLNIENSEIEIPYKPIIRVCTPVAGKDGEKKGIIILNYFASIVLRKLSSINDELMLLNEEGYWLQSPNEEDEWGFMFDEEETFASRHPEEWLAMTRLNRGYIENNDGLWIFITVNPLRDALLENPQLFKFDDDKKIYSEGEYTWKIISHITNEELDGLRREAAFPILLSSIILYPLAFYGAWNLARRIEMEKQEDERIRYTATHDMMTGLFNRAMLEAELGRLTNSRLYPVSIFILDANNLKVINDQQGHLEGDRLLKAIAEVLQQSFRTEDIISRYGGDEFVVLLPLTDKDTCLEIQKRLLQNIKLYNENSSMIKIDVAIGIATTKKEETLTEVMKRADERMYARKASMKAEST